MQIFEREVGEGWNVSLLLEECLKEIESSCLIEMHTERMREWESERGEGGGEGKER